MYSYLNIINIINKNLKKQDIISISIIYYILQRNNYKTYKLLLNQALLKL
jgi:hypothetical protein